MKAYLISFIVMSWCNDTITRITFWTGKVGLIYPSDYGYATSGGTGVNRTNCLNQQMYDWNNSSNDDCKTNDWLYNSSLWQWVITPSTHSTNAVSVFAIFGEGHIGYTYARDQYAVRPSVYLLSTVKITQGEGTLENPYVLGK